MIMIEETNMRPIDGKKVYVSVDMFGREWFTFSPWSKARIEVHYADAMLKQREK